MQAVHPNLWGIRTMYNYTVGVNSGFEIAQKRSKLVGRLRGSYLGMQLTSNCNEKCSTLILVGIARKQKSTHSSVTCSSYQHVKASPQRASATSRLSVPHRLCSSKKFLGLDLDQKLLGADNNQRRWKIVRRLS